MPRCCFILYFHMRSINRKNSRFTPLSGVLPAIHLSQLSLLLYELLMQFIFLAKTKSLPAFSAHLFSFPRYHSFLLRKTTSVALRVFLMKNSWAAKRKAFLAEVKILPDFSAHLFSFPRFRSFLLRKTTAVALRVFPS